MPTSIFLCRLGKAMPHWLLLPGSCGEPDRVSPGMVRIHHRFDHIVVYRRLRRWVLRISYWNDKQPMQRALCGSPGQLLRRGKHQFCRSPLCDGVLLRGRRDGATSLSCGDVRFIYWVVD